MILPLSYRQIEKFLLMGDEGIEDLIVNCEPVFEIVDEVNKQIINNDNISFVEYDEYSKKLTGCIMFLKAIECQAESFRHNVRNDKVGEFKLSGEKGMTDLVVKSKSEVAVKRYHHLVTILNGYISRSYCGIQDCERKAINKKYEWKGLTKTEEQ